MFTTGNFIKFIAALVLTGLTANNAFFSVIGFIVGLGDTGAVIAFFIRFLIWWFLISSFVGFIAFAFGGGMGRYSTTKIYRHLQLFTFYALISIPVWIIITVLITPTPIGAHTERYYRQVEDVRAKRLREAQQNRNTRIAAAEQKLSAQRADWQRRKRKIFSDAELLRQAKMREKTAELHLKIYSEYENKLKSISRTNFSLWNRLGDLPIGDVRNEFGTAQLTKQLRTHFGKLVKDKIISVKPDAQRKFLDNFLSEDFFSEEFYNDEFCQTSMKFVTDIKVFYKHHPRANCVMYSILFEDVHGPVSKYFELSKRRQERLDERFKGRLNFVRQTFVGLVNGTKKYDVTVAERDKKIAKTKHVEPAIDPNDPELLKMVGTFPPDINRDDFKLIVDQSGYGVYEPFSLRLGATVEKHWWWLYLISLAIVFFQRERIQKYFFKIYGKAARILLYEGRFGFGGSARFATIFEEWGSKYKEGTLYVGRSLANFSMEVGLDGEAHMLTVAGSRGGKGATAIIPNLLLWQGSAVVIDPKGTNAHVTAEARRRMGHKVYLIDPFNIVTKESDRFDPFEALDPADRLVRERIASITDALVVPDDNTKDKHWDDGAKTIISGLISQVISSRAEEKNLYYIRDLIFQLPEDQDALWAAMAANDSAGGSAKDAAMRYIRGSQTNEILGLLSNADKHTEWLSSPVMREVTSQPTFSLRSIKDTPTTVYLIIPPRQLERQKRLLRLFVNLMIDTMEIGGRSKVPVLMLMDKFLALGKMPEIPAAFATMASYNLTLWPFVQDLGQMMAMYDEGFNSFVANSRAMQVFAVSDKKTREFISETIGNRPLGNLSDIVRSSQNVPLRSPDDVVVDVAASDHRQYVLRTGQAPMILEKVFYFKNGTRFAGKYDPDPDFAG